MANAETCDDIGSLLSKAAHNGNLELVKNLIENGADVNSKTPLCAASENGHLEIVKYLLDNGADINLVRSHLDTPLIAALFSKQSETDRFLIENGASVNCLDCDDFSVLDYASINGDLTTVKMLVENGANCKNRGLYFAANNGFLDLVKYFHGLGAEVNYMYRGYTPLNMAATNNHLDVVEYLTTNGADVNLFSEPALHPIFWSAYYGHFDVVKYLTNSGADVSSGLQVAAGRGHLVDNGADLDTADEDGRTALFDAADGGYLDVVKFLVEKGADVNVKTVDGLSPLDDIVKYLIDNGAKKDVVH